MIWHDMVNFVLILTRVSTFIAFFPIFGRRQVPAILKAGLSVGLTYFWFAQVDYRAIPETQTMGEIPALVYILLSLREFGIGLLLAVLCGWMLVPAKIAGQYVGQELGLSMAAVADPSSPDSAGEVGQLFDTLAILLFFGLNLHHGVLWLMDVSFRELGGMIDLSRLPIAQIVETCQRLDHYGLLIIAPLGICLFVLNLALVYLNKAAPALNLFSVGMAVRGFVGLVGLYLFLPVIVQALGHYFGEVERDIHSNLALFQYYDSAE